MNDIYLNLDDASATFDVIPTGDYPMRAIKMEVKDTKGGSGKMLKVQFQIVDGPHANRIVFEQFNIVNPKREAVQIAVGQIKSWIKACTGQEPTGQLALSRVFELEGAVFVGNVRLEKDIGFGEQNRIKAFKAAPGYAAPPSAGAGYQQAAPHAPLQSQGAMPWTTRK